MFTSPGTYTSQGTTGYLATLSTGVAVSPPTSPPSYNYTPVIEMRTFEVKLLDVPNVDFTHLQSPNNTREIRPGMIMPGTIDFTSNAILDATQLGVLTNAQLQANIPFQIKAPIQDSNATLVFTGIAFTKTAKLGPFENDKPNELAGSFQMEGSYNILTD